MKYSWKDRIKNYALLQRAIAFLMTIGLIFIFLPKEGLFQYEYQLNQPWNHERLFSPFDFGIRKTEEEVQAEKQRIVDHQAKVFSIDEDRVDRILRQVDSDWETIQSDTTGRAGVIGESMSRLLGGWMTAGIVQQDEYTKSLKHFDPVMVARDGGMKRHYFRELITIQQVADSIDRWGVEFYGDTLDSALVGLAKELMLNRVMPVLVYNDSLTGLLIAAKHEKIVLLEGKVNRGEAIIDQGDLVTEAKYKVLESLKKEYAERAISATGFQWSLVGEMAIAAILVGLLMLFVYLNQDRVFNDPRPITLTLSLVTISFVMCSLAYTSKAISVYVIPIGIAPLLLRMFYDFRISIFSFLVLTLIIALFSTNPLEFIVIQTSAISFATLYQSTSTKRSRMLGTALLVFAGYSVIYVAISVAQHGGFTGIMTENFGWFALNALLCMMVFPLIYVVEKVFGYVSETTLLELSDSNQPLLKELAVTAPGTFQHSLQVANLCEKVASKIGGDRVLLRTAAMYHDVGKMLAPQYFIENQLPDNNPHDDLEPEESAEIIIGHVLKGIEMTKKHGLPIEVIQFIRTHHGTSTVRYFLNKAQKRGEEVDEEKYQYPGPKPKTKEQAILMMCDSVEAASRSLKKYDHETLEGLVEGIVSHQQAEGQFEEAPLTFQDIGFAKSVLKTALKGIFHQRISYE